MTALFDYDDPIIRSLTKAGILKEMTPAERMAAPSPTQVSNRTIHDRCLAWGCKVTRTSGNWVWMTSAMGAKFKIRPPQQHEANAKSAIDDMLEAIAVPWTEFIAAEIVDISEFVKIGEGFVASEYFHERPGDVMGPCSICGEDVVRAVMVKSGKKIAHKYCVAKPVEQPSSPEPEKENETVPDILEVIFDPEADALSATASDERPRQRGIINQVFDLLVERGDSMSNQSVAEQLGITVPQASSALAGLCQQGVITRIKSGVYQAKPHVTRRSSNVGVVLTQNGQVDHERPMPQELIRDLTARGYSPITGEQLAAVLEPDATEDETLNEILDLIAPNGFKARHLPLIDAFKRSALALMREVNKDA